MRTIDELIEKLQALRRWEGRNFTIGRAFVGRILIWVVPEAWWSEKDYDNARAYMTYERARDVRFDCHGGQVRDLRKRQTRRAA